jgi:aspartyl-tRNA(Asn)/glutamyl-tRNA(Gln) amidotransferase subunit A
MRACERQSEEEASEACREVDTIVSMSMVGDETQTIRALLESQLTDAALSERLEQCLLRSNGNANHNTYLWQDAEWSRRELARALERRAAAGGKSSGLELAGVPVSLKDCFDLAGTRTTLGSRFYAERNPVAQMDSWVAARLRAMGAVITGKTHLHALAYGITGENRDYGDCVQPRNAGWLTGGSSSGAVASVQEGSALAAIGTDTGGSVRVPAALCGLVGYRSSLGRGSWQGGHHLAQSFDTIGWLFRHLEDAPLLAQLFDAERGRESAEAATRFAYVDAEYLRDCEPEVKESYDACVEELRGLGLKAAQVAVPWWEEAQEIFAAVQAWEAARIHAENGAGDFAVFEAPIEQRLKWGAGIGDDEMAALRQRHREFGARIAALLGEHEMVVLPCAPVACLRAGEDHTSIRARLLRYTAPASLGGLPALAVPFAAGGMQVLAARGDDARLLTLAERMGRARRAAR